ncbi:hypothetical protein BU26DRAFT_412548 [Trematosphaeria pertusa]|uniref:Uncharacterized protein n=1 Tax=Trematosphaeria pertusa TaxID=390896 RepID=A0A6A6J028_9PLEO|nr:uncharacterized protein BU26DRAFT_412548 [Trematosphaeria pertusa]KAF2256195.1 hypothetical protein BU26DRAFT_412548 [Trematosphaeria pertusa]
MAENTIPGLVLDTRLAYRVGSPLLPTLPLNTIWGLHKESPRLYSMIPGIKLILKEHEVLVEYMDIVRRFHRGEQPQGRGLTLLVLSDVTIESQRQNCVRSVQAIKELLIREELDIALEIIDGGAEKGLMSYPITTSQRDIIAAWKPFQATVLEKIAARAWISIDVLHRSLRETDTPQSPTIVISAADADDEAWWNDILPTLFREAPSNFSVELVFQNSIFSTRGQGEPKPTKADGQRVLSSCITGAAYERHVQMGSSIGRTGQDGTGTLGAHIILKEKESGRRVELGLSNHHVLCDEETVEQVCAAEDWLSPRHELVKQNCLHVVTPSDQDHNILLAKTRNDITDTVRSIRAMSQDPSQSGYLDATTKQCNDARDLIIKAQSATRTLGTVYASSGWRTVENEQYDEDKVRQWSTVRDESSDKIRPLGKDPEETMAKMIGDDKLLQWAVDWSLVQIASPRVLLPTVPTVSTAVQLSTNSIASQWAILDPEKSYPVAKIGRTTGWTTGKINAVASILQLRHDRSSVVPVDLRHRFGRPILSYGILASGERDFLAPGDSGSAILLDKPQEQGDDSTSCIVGLGFASNRATLVSYMMPMELVVADIEKVTGGQVLKPTYSGKAAGDV